jgi:hypothetical protein
MNPTAILLHRRRASGTARVKSALGPTLAAVLASDGTQRSGPSRRQPRAYELSAALGQRQIALSTLYAAHPAPADPPHGGSAR